ncbi:MAG: peptide deformylase [Candidatus Kapaibacterium sp.]|nr:MAG: peptide deformylase [Candidatus Kapabacteria bacterium]
MAILPIYTFDHPILKQVSTPVAEMTGEIKLFVKNLFETMNNADGIGLAANQVGSEHAITVIDIGDLEEDDLKSGKKAHKTPPLVLINPVIEAFSEEKEDFEEGCLSLPTFRDKVTRPTGIQVRFYDLDMKEHRLEADGLLSRVMQHEIDHLNGIYFFERLSPMRRAMAHPKLRRIQLGQAEAEYPVYLEQKHPQRRKKKK